MAKDNYNIGDTVKDFKTGKIATIINKYPSKTEANKYYYFIAFKNGTGCYRSQIYITQFKS